MKLNVQKLFESIQNGVNISHECMSAFINTCFCFCGFMLISLPLINTLLFIFDLYLCDDSAKLYILSVSKSLQFKAVLSIQLDFIMLYLVAVIFLCYRRSHIFTSSLELFLFLINPSLLSVSPTLLWSPSVS